MKIAEKHIELELKPITRWVIFLVVITALLASLILFYENFVDENTLHFFFSSIFQGVSGLLGFLGVFIVYKLQTISTENNHIFDQIIFLANNERIDYLDLKSMQEKSIEGFYKESQKVREKYLGLHPSFCWTYLTFRKQFLENEKHIHEIKNKMKLPTMIMVILIGFSLIFLLLTNPILSSPVKYFMVTIVWVFLSLIFILAAYIYNIFITILLR